MNLSENERKVLAYLVDSEMFFGFSTIASDTRLSRKEVREACRSLTDKKLVTYARTTWDDDGNVGGAGYGATRAGIDYARSQNLKFEEPTAEDAALAAKPAA